MNLLEQLKLTSMAPAPRRERPWVAANLIKGHMSRADKAKARYAAALQEWTSTTQLEFKLGMSSTSANMTLKRYLASGLLSRRPRGGEYNRKYGWEWKWNQK